MAFYGALVLLLIAAAICAHQLQDSIRHMRHLQARNRRDGDGDGHDDGSPGP